MFQTRKDVTRFLSQYISDMNDYCSDEAYSNTSVEDLLNDIHKYYESQHQEYAEWRAIMKKGSCTQEPEHYFIDDNDCFAVYKDGTLITDDKLTKVTYASYQEALQAYLIKLSAYKPLKARDLWLKEIGNPLPLCLEGLDEDELGEDNDYNEV